MARDYALNAIVPAPGIPIGYLETEKGRVAVYVSEEWRRQWFEFVGVSLFGETGEEDVTQNIGAGGIVTLGTGTVGDYVESVSGNGATGVIVTGGTGEGSTPVVSLSQDLQASASPTFANIIVTGNVDGRDVSADGATLDGLVTTVADKVTKDATITAASEAHTLNATFDNAEVEAALNALGAIINEMRAAFNA